VTGSTFGCHTSSGALTKVLGDLSILGTRPALTNFYMVPKKIFYEQMQNWQKITWLQ